jgi:riboflavin kinase / FMN adenylyltransferase
VLDSRPSAVSLGMFDGLHLGHRKILGAAKEYALSNNLKTVVLTLSNHPRTLLSTNAPKLISDLDTRIELFKDFGIDELMILEFTEDLMNMEAQDYLDKFLKDTLNARFISVGYDHHFAKNRSGNVEFLEEWCLENSCVLHVEPEFKLEGESISSSRIRSRIALGEIGTANKMLGYNFKLVSEVIHGHSRGRDLGFRTANLKINPDLVLPANGVYYGLAHLKRGNELITQQSLVNIGFRPSFDDGDDLSCEVHLLDFDEDIYGQKLKVEFQGRLRDEIKFAKKEDLLKQIKYDIQGARALIRL